MTQFIEFSLFSKVRMRTFVGIPVKLPPELSKSVSHWKSVYEGEALRWVSPEKLHLTLRFFGEIQEDEIAELKKHFYTSYKGSPKSCLSMDMLGFFGRRQSPRVLWSGFASSEPVQELYTKTLVLERYIHPVMDTATYSPHITLARIGRKGISGKFREEIESHRQQYWGQMELSSVVLYESVITQKGARYNRIEEVALD